MAISKSVMRRLEIQRAPKQPKQPNMPASAQETAQKLHRIIDEGGERAKTMAYAALSRLCVLWAPEAFPEEQNPLGGGNFGIVTNELLVLMFELFPNL